MTGCPREPEGITEAESRARGNNAGPLGVAPGARLLCGLEAPSITGVSGQPPPIFTRAGRHPQGHRRLLCSVKGLDDISMAYFPWFWRMRIVPGLGGCWVADKTGRGHSWRRASSYEVTWPAGWNGFRGRPTNRSKASWDAAA